MHGDPLRPGLAPALAGQRFNTDFEDPPAFTLAHGKLNLMIIAKAIPNRYVADQIKTTAWVYETCEKDPASAAWSVQSCDGVLGTVARNAGPVLKLKPGDLLKIRFVNQLPPAADFANAAATPFLHYNPTNLHAHGMLVEPRTPTAKRNTYGDTIYALAFPSANVASNNGAYLFNKNPLPSAPGNVTVPIGLPRGRISTPISCRTSSITSSTFRRTTPRASSSSTRIRTGQRRTRCKPGFPRWLRLAAIKTGSARTGCAFSRCPRSPCAIWR